MSLNIKNEETCQLVDELAELIGETKTGAITIALKERLEREKKLANREILAQHLCEIGQSCAEADGAGTLLYGAWRFSLRRDGAP